MRFRSTYPGESIRYSSIVAGHSSRAAVCFICGGLGSWRNNANCKRGDSAHDQNLGKEEEAGFSELYPHPANLCGFNHCHNPEILHQGQEEFIS